MVATALQNSLLEEFQSLHEILTSGEFSSCLGITQKGMRCRNPVALESKAKLLIIASEVIELIEKGHGCIEDTLQKASCLVMCKGVHQGQATDKCNAWMEMIPFLTGQLSQEDCDIKPAIPSPSTSPFEDVTPTASLLNEQQTEAGTFEKSQAYAQSPSLLSCQSVFDSDFEDSGYQSGDENDSKSNSPATHLSTDKASHSSISNDYVMQPPRTPEKAPPIVWADSAISMSFDLSSEGQAKKSLAKEIGLESPLASKTAEYKPVKLNFQTPPPAATLTPPKLFQNITKSGSTAQRTFGSFKKHHSHALMEFIEESLGSGSLKDGYIYCFQVDGCAFYKIGCVTQRGNDKSLDDSFDRRMKEHKRCGWCKVKIVLKSPLVKHALRIEGIIHRHLTEKRKKEKNMDPGSNGRKCKHKTHTEWFDVPLKDIYDAIWPWARWINTHPYIEIDGHFFLSPKWEQNFKTLRIENTGNYPINWLGWLGCYVPYSPTAVKADAPRTKCNSGLTDQDRKNDGSTTITITELTEDPRVDEELHAPAVYELPEREIAFRLKHTGTW